MIAACVTFLGVLLPWVNAPFLSRSGIEMSDGKVVGVLAITALVSGLLLPLAQRRLGLVYLVCGGIGGVAAVCDLGDVFRLGDAFGSGGFGSAVKPGIGLYLDVGALLGLAVSGINLIFRRT